MNAASSATRQRRVVVIDDDADGRDMLSLLLQAEGIEVRMVNDAAAVVPGVVAFEPDVVLLDLDRADGRSHRLAGDIRADPKLQQALIVAMTGWSGVTARTQAQLAGFHACFIKGDDPAVLIALAKEGMHPGVASAQGLNALAFVDDGLDELATR